MPVIDIIVIVLLAAFFAAMTVRYIRNRKKPHHGCQGCSCCQGCTALCSENKGKNN